MNSFTGGTLANKTGINLETIRYYEKIGLMPKPKRKESRYRIYSEIDFARLKFIIRAKELGFTLQEITEMLSLKFVATFIAFPYLGFAKSGQKQLTYNPKFQTVALNINNMDCEACALGLQRQLKNIPGLKDTKVDFNKANAIINYDPTKVNASKFVKVLTEFGYPAEYEDINISVLEI